MVKSAELRRKIYLDNSETFETVVVPLLEERHKVRIARDTFTDIVKESLEKRGIHYQENLGDLRTRNKSAVAILGETFHFVYKFTIRNYEYRNPIPLLKLTFDALGPIDNEYAAKFLFAICALMPQDGKKKHSDTPRLAGLVESVLPILFGEYTTSLGTIERYRKDEQQYRCKKSSLDSFYKKSLDLALEITERAIKQPITLDWKEFAHEREKRRVCLDFKTKYVPTYLI